MKTSQTLITCNLIFHNQLNRYNIQNSWRNFIFTATNTQFMPWILKPYQLSYYSYFVCHQLFSETRTRHSKTEDNRSELSIPSILMIAWIAFRPSKLELLLTLKIIWSRLLLAKIVLCLWLFFSIIIILKYYIRHADLICFYQFHVPVWVSDIHMYKIEWLVKISVCQSKWNTGQGLHYVKSVYQIRNKLQDPKFPSLKSKLPLIFLGTINR